MPAKLIDEELDLAARLQDTFMQLETSIPEVLQAGKSYQLSMNQARALHLINGNPGIFQKDIARVLVVTPASVSVFVRRMAEQGLLESHPHPEDRRANGLYLTDLGKKVQTAVRENLIANTRDFLAVLSIEQQRQVVESLEYALAMAQEQAG